MSSVSVMKMRSFMALAPDLVNLDEVVCGGQLEVLPLLLHLLRYLPGCEL
jgi:hypothetical protein